MLIPTTILTGGTGAVALIQGVVLDADAASIDFQSIPGTYRHLEIIAQLRGTAAVENVNLVPRINNDSGANYDHYLRGNNNGAAYSSEGIATATPIAGLIAAGTAATGKASSFHIVIPNYVGTTFHKLVRTMQGVGFQEAINKIEVESAITVWRSTAAVTRFALVPASGNLLAGSVATLYGRM